MHQGMTHHLHQQHHRFLRHHLLVRHHWLPKGIKVVSRNKGGIQYMSYISVLSSESKIMPLAFSHAPHGGSAPPMVLVGISAALLKRIDWKSNKNAMNSVKKTNFDICTAKN